ncbi:MAG: Gfo/Idh/MocA family oxidoreductase [Planctomycetota bacterium]
MPDHPKQPRSPNQVRLGVIGCGSIALGRHLPILRQTPGCEVMAIADTDTKNRSAATRMCPGSIPFDSSEAMLDTAQLDAVVIATPNHTHAPVASACLAAGKHVYLEKPVATRREEIDGLLGAWKASGCLCVAGFNYRYLESVLKARKLIGEGALGKILTIQSVFCTPGESLPAWKASLDSGGGALLDYGSHHLDLFGFMLDDVPVSASVLETSRKSEGDSAWLTGCFTGGARYQSFFASAATDEDRIEILGTNGQLTLHRVGSRSLFRRDKSRTGLARRLAGHWSMSALGQAASVRRATEASTTASLAAFIRAVRVGRYDSPEQPTLEDGVRCLRLLLDARDSDRSRETDAA